MFVNVQLSFHKIHILTYNNCYWDTCNRETLFPSSAPGRLKICLTFSLSHHNMVSDDTFKAEGIVLADTKARIESELEVRSYLQDLRYALDHNAKVTFQADRIVDHNRAQRFTNQFTVADLFPDENPVAALKRELKTLTVEEYMQTVKDLRYPSRSEMREFGKLYDGKGDVYIKIRVELLSADGNHTTFVMSFHYAEIPFTPNMFPYRK